MDLLELLFTPINLLFLIIAVGLIVGRVKIVGISFGVSGILFVAILVGFILNTFFVDEIFEAITDTQDTMQIISRLGTSLFVAVIGLQSGLSLRTNSKGASIAFIIGALMSIAGVTSMLLINLIDPMISEASLLGLICGALTSTPGLSNVCDLIPDHRDAAVLSYGCTYPIGVILAVIFVQIFLYDRSERNSKSLKEENVLKKPYSEILWICLSAFLGNFIGNIPLPFTNICFGSTAGVLLIGVCIGFFLKATHTVTETSPPCFKHIKDLGLALFLASNGLTTGLQIKVFEVKFFLYGLLITLSAILTGFILCRLFLKNSRCQACVIAGGLTSTPAYGAIQKSETETTNENFSFAYLGALSAIIICIQFLAR